jgi:hypothetical protein
LIVHRKFVKLIYTAEDNTGNTVFRQLALTTPTKVALPPDPIKDRSGLLKGGE